jgi:hypothetical protein
VFKAIRLPSGRVTVMKAISGHSLRYSGADGNQFIKSTHFIQHLNEMQGPREAVPASRSVFRDRIIRDDWRLEKMDRDRGYEAIEILAARTHGNERLFMRAIASARSMGSS